LHVSVPDADSLFSANGNANENDSQLREIRMDAWTKTPGLQRPAESAVVICQTDSAAITLIFGVVQDCHSFHCNSSALDAAFDEPVPLSPVTTSAAFTVMGMALLHLRILNDCGA
jgi:hypothetical protein